MTISKRKQNRHQYLKRDPEKHHKYVHAFLKRRKERLETDKIFVQQTKEFQKKYRKVLTQQKYNEVDLTEHAKTLDTKELFLVGIPNRTLVLHILKRLTVNHLYEFGQTINIQNNSS